MNAVILCFIFVIGCLSLFGFFISFVCFKSKLYTHTCRAPPPFRKNSKNATLFIPTILNLYNKHSAYTPIINFPAQLCWRHSKGNYILQFPLPPPYQPTPLPFPGRYHIYLYQPRNWKCVTYVACVWKQKPQNTQVKDSNVRTH